MLHAVVGRACTEAPLFARLLAARLRAELVAVPAAAAAEVAHGTHLGARIAAATAADTSLGTPLPSALVAPLVTPKLQRALLQPGSLVLAGFPRTLDQLTMLQQAGLPALPRVIHLMLPREEAERRLAERHVCGNCGEPMRRLPAEAGAPAGLHAHLLEEATECDAPAPRRAAIDAEESVLRRLNAFDAHTVPLLERMEARGAEVLHVPVSESAHDTWAAIEAACGLEPLVDPGQPLQPAMQAAMQ
jgi:adenylate kinase family enzyme